MSFTSLTDMQLKLLRRNRVFTGRVFSAVVDDVEYPSGRHSIREVAEHPGGATVLALFPDKGVVLIRQHRYPLDAFIWELPAGKLEPGEEPLLCARRELAEETGYTAGRWQKLHAIYTTPGFCNEELHIFLATELRELPEGRQLEEGEQSMTTEIVPLDEAIAMIDRGEICDAKTICGIFLGQRFIQHHQEGDESWNERK